MEAMALKRRHLAHQRSSRSEEAQDQAGPLGVKHEEQVNVMGARGGRLCGGEIPLGTNSSMCKSVFCGDVGGRQVCLCDRALTLGYYVLAVGHARTRKEGFAGAVHRNRTVIQRWDFITCVAQLYITVSKSLRKNNLKRQRVIQLMVSWGSDSHG